MRLSSCRHDRVEPDIEAAAGSDRANEPSDDVEACLRLHHRRRDRDAPVGGPEGVVLLRRMAPCCRARRSPPQRSVRRVQAAVQTRWRARHRDTADLLRDPGPLVRPRQLLAVHLRQHPRAHRHASPGRRCVPPHRRSPDRSTASRRLHRVLRRRLRIPLRPKRDVRRIHTDLRSAGNSSEPEDRDLRSTRRRHQRAVAVGFGPVEQLRISGCCRRCPVLLPDPSAVARLLSRWWCHRSSS